MQPAKKFDRDWFWAHINDIYKYTWNPDTQSFDYHPEGTVVANCDNGKQEGEAHEGKYTGHPGG